MADLLAYMFWSHLPCVKEERRFINGREQPCLIIPVKENQLKKGHGGNWLSVFILNELPPNELQITNNVKLVFNNNEEVNRAKSLGVYEKSQRMGRCYIIDHTSQKKIDRSNNAADIRCFGTICLTDIPKSELIQNNINGKHFIHNLVFRPINHDKYVLTGSICVEDIPREDIKTNPENGKKYIEVALYKLKYLDTYMNTHQLVIQKKNGDDIEIGKFKLWEKEGVTPSNTPPAEKQEEHTTTISARPKPKKIDGLNF